MILFYPDFFLDYNVQQNDDPLENQCKLSMKSCLGVFRSMKQVRNFFFQFLKMYLTAKERSVLVPIHAF